MKHHPNSLESTILALLISTEELSYDVTAYELTHDGDGWSVNTPFRIASGVTKEKALEVLRARWEIFKVNYCSKARVRDLTDISDMEKEYELEVGCVPFARVNAL